MKHHQAFPFKTCIKVVEGGTELEVYSNEHSPNELELDLDDGERCMGVILSVETAKDLQRLLTYFIQFGHLPINKEALELFEHQCVVVDGELVDITRIGS